MGKTFAQLEQAPPQFKREPIEVEEWGGTFYLASISGLAHKELMQEFRKMGKNWQVDGGAEIPARLLSKCLVDDEGKSPTFEWLMGQPLVLLTKLAEPALKMNGMTPGAQEELEKN